MGARLPVEKLTERLAEAVSPGHGALLLASRGVAVLGDAADELARLRAESAELRDELERHIHAAAQWYESVGDDPDVLLKDADALLTRLLGRAPR